jgi:hypothetical protein
MWTDNENSILIEYCNKKISIKEISIALNRTEKDVKFHIGDLAFEEINKNDAQNDIQKVEDIKKNCCIKYNLTLQQLEGAIVRNQRKQNNNKKITAEKNTKFIDDQLFKKEVLKLLREIRNMLNS